MFFRGLSYKHFGGGFWRLMVFNQFRQLHADYTFQDRPYAKWAFKDHYQKFVLPHVRTFEVARLEALQKYRARGMYTIPLWAVAMTLTVLIALENNNFDDGHFGFMFILTGGAFFWMYLPVRAYKKSVKKDVFPNIFNFFGESFKYQEKCPFSVDKFKESGLIPHHTSEYKEDYIQGTYKDVDLKLFEAKLTKQSGSGKNRRTVTVFRGMFLTLTMNKRFKGKTIVKRDSGKVLNWLNDKFDGKDMQRVALEDPEFEKQFEVQSNDQVEARYLLTTSFMERLKKLSELFGGERIECSFYNKQVLFKIHSSKNRFEVSSIYKPATFEDDIHGIMTEMAVIFEMIEHLKLHEQTRL